MCYDHPYHDLLRYNNINVHNVNLFTCKSSTFEATKPLHVTVSFLTIFFSHFSSVNMSYRRKLVTFVMSICTLSCIYTGRFKDNVYSC